VRVYKKCTHKIFKKKEKIIKRKKKKRKEKRKKINFLHKFMRGTI